MGRRPKEVKEDNPNIVVDRVGEKTDLSLCPACPVYGAQPDCFACIDGRCTALKETDETGICSFYRSTEDNMAVVRKCYRRLRDMGRSDLIDKYVKPLTALGLLDDEIKAAEQYGEEFDTFRESNYREQLDKAIDGGLDDDLLDDSDADADDADADDADDADEVDDADDYTEEEDDDAGDGDDPCDDTGQ